MESEPYRAAADYAAESEEEVSLKTGDMVDVVKKEDNGSFQLPYDDDDVIIWLFF